VDAIGGTAVETNTSAAAVGPCCGRWVSQAAHTKALVALISVQAAQSQAAALERLALAEVFWAFFLLLACGAERDFTRGVEVAIMIGGDEST